MDWPEVIFSILAPTLCTLQKSLYLQQIVLNPESFFIDEKGSTVLSTRPRPQNRSFNAFSLAEFLAAPGIVRQSYPAVVFIPSDP